MCGSVSAAVDKGRCFPQLYPQLAGENFRGQFGVWLLARFWRRTGTDDILLGVDKTPPFRAAS